jgi:hypothetical protein
LLIEAVAHLHADPVIWTVSDGVQAVVDGTLQQVAASGDVRSDFVSS